MKTHWYKQNRDKQLEYFKAYYKANKEKRKKVYIAPSKEYQMLYSAKTRAKRRGLECTIVLEDIVIPSHCPVLGTPMVSPSIDRFDNTKGYTKENIRIISKRANVLKSNATIEELQQIIRYMQG